MIVYLKEHPGNCEIHKTKFYLTDSSGNCTTDLYYADTMHEKVLEMMILNIHVDQSNLYDSMFKHYFPRKRFVDTLICENCNRISKSNRIESGVDHSFIYHGNKCDFCGHYEKVER